MDSERGEAGLDDRMPMRIGYKCTYCGETLRSPGMCLDCSRREVLATLRGKTLSHVDRKPSGAVDDYIYDESDDGEGPLGKWKP